MTCAADSSLIGDERTAQSWHYPSVPLGASNALEPHFVQSSASPASLEPSNQTVTPPGEATFTSRRTNRSPPCSSLTSWCKL